jgi:DNA repair protein RecO (recombination protein O)
MPSYNLTAINLGGFQIGESDKVISMFSAERGLVRAVAKGAKKPGTKMAGKSEALCANKLMIAKGRSLDIITQAESIDTFRRVRSDLTRLTFALYYAELTQAFGEGLEEESEVYYHVLFNSLRMQEAAIADARQLSLEFSMFLLNQLGVSPELTVCVKCREPLTEYSIAAFYSEMGGVGCNRCGQDARSKQSVAESSLRNDYSSRSGQRRENHDHHYEERGIFVTKLVWKILVNASVASEDLMDPEVFQGGSQRPGYSEAQAPALDAAHRLMQRYLEERAGKKMRTLDLLKQF